MKSSSTDTIRVGEKYDEVMYADYVRAIWAGSDFCNFGYWQPDTTDHGKACENLVDALLDFIPGKPSLILDVACGLGATTGHIAKRYSEATVVGVNISTKQLGTARRKQPNCDFAQMDAIALAFPNNSFDSIVCVEAAFHFETREQFLSEAFRVLKPGGFLVLSDILAGQWLSRVRSSPTIRNITVSLDSYREAYGACGFVNPCVIDSTTESIARLCRYHRRWCTSKLKESWDVRPLMRLMLFDFMLLAGIRHYLLVAARKP